MRRWRKIVIALSLSMNVLCLGAVGFALYKWPVRYLAAKFRTDPSAVPEHYRAAKIRNETDVPPGSIVFLGDSLTDLCEWSYFLGNPRAVTRGVGGEKVDGILSRGIEIARCKPEKIFLMSGINDLLEGGSGAHVASSIRSFVQSIHKVSPDTIVCLQSILPVNASIVREVSNATITETNRALTALADGNQIVFVDLYHDFVDKTGNAVSSYYDCSGIHLTLKGYEVWRERIAPLLATGQDRKPGEGHSVVPADSNTGLAGPGRPKEPALQQ